MKDYIAAWYKAFNSSTLAVLGFPCRISNRTLESLPGFYVSYCTTLLRIRKGERGTISGAANNIFCIKTHQKVLCKLQGRNKGEGFPSPVFNFQSKGVALPAVCIQGDKSLGQGQQAQEATNQLGGS